MDGVLLQSKLYMGYAKSAQRVGLPFDIYRPVAAANPLNSGNFVVTIPASFTEHSASNFNFGKPSDYKSSLSHGLLDGTQVEIGDYLVHATAGTYFIAAKDPIVPIFCVNTNRIVTIFKPDDQQRQPGLGGYGGTVASTPALLQSGDANETPVMTAWPASVLGGSHGAGGMVLPGDIGTGMFRVLLPSFGGILIRPGYVVTDDADKRMIVKMAELGQFGWNLQAQQAIV